MVNNWCTDDDIKFGFKIDYLDLQKTADSGQCFRWKKIDVSDEGFTGYEVPAFHRILKIYQKDNEFMVNCSEEEFNDIWYDYLDLGTPYEEYVASVLPEDSFLKAASDYGKGIRILKQDPWEASISFIISQCNNIPRIKGCIEKICKNFGDDGIYFPTAERLSSLSLEEEEIFRKNCSLGYRDEYILNFSKMVVSGEFSLSDCAKLPYKECVKQLKTVKGIGQKVADCIALFGFHSIDAFPLDVHMKEVLDRHYYTEDLSKLSKKKQYDEMVNRDFSRYDGYKGIVQQWIFAYEIYCVKNKTLQ